MNSLISIIIPTYNRADLIEETLQSILNQTYTNWECIVVDDGSTDNTGEILSAYTAKDNRIKYYKRPESYKKGANSCRNYGFELSIGDYIKWFDSDDILLPKALETSSEYFSKSYDLIVSSLEYVDFYKTKLKKKHAYFSSNLLEDYLVGKITFYTFTPTWKRAFLEKSPNLFDENIGNLDDWDFNLRMLYREPNAIYIDEALIQYRVHENSLSKELDKLNLKEIQSEFLARDKHIELLKTNKLVNSKIFTEFVIDRYKYFLREALIKKDPISKYLIKQTLIKQLKLGLYKSFFNTLFGYVSFIIFNKGYKFLK